MADAFVQVTGSNDVGSGTTCAVSVANAPAAGNRVYVAAGASASSISSVADTKGNSYTADAGSGSGNPKLQGWWTDQGVGTLTTADTITVTFASSTGSKSVVVCEFSGVGTADTAVPAVLGAQTGTSISVAAAGAQQQADEMLIGAVAWAAGSALTLTAGAGWTIASQHTHSGGAYAGAAILYQTVESSGTPTLTATLSAAPTDWSAEILAWKATGAATVSLTGSDTASASSGTAAATRTLSRSATSTASGSSGAAAATRILSRSATSTASASSGSATATVTGGSGGTTPYALFATWFDAASAGAQEASGTLSAAPTAVAAALSTYRVQPTTVQVFNGYIREILSAPNPKLDPTATISLIDLLATLQASYPVIAEIGASTTGGAILACLRAIGWPAAQTSLAVGDPIPGFSLDGTVDCLTAIGSLLAAEGGIFFIASDGTPTYIDHLGHPQPDGTLFATNLLSAGMSLDTVANTMSVTRTDEAGTPLGKTQTYQDAGSATAYGPRSVSVSPLSTPYVVSDEQALVLAARYVADQKDPRSPLWSATLHRNPADGQTFQLMLATDIGDHIFVSDSGSGTSGDYDIEGVTHQVQMAGLDHTVTWVADERLGTAFTVGQSLLGGSDTITS